MTATKAARPKAPRAVWCVVDERGMPADPRTTKAAAELVRMQYWQSATLRVVRYAPVIPAPRGKSKEKP